VRCITASNDMEDAVVEQALRPFAAAGVALVGAGMIAVTPVVKLPALPDVQTAAIQLTATEADAFALLINVLDPGAFTNGISAAPTDSIGDLAVSLDQVIDLGGTPYITAADNLATDLLPLLDIASLFSGATTSLDTLLSDLANLPNLSTVLSDLGTVLTDLSNLPTATDIANDVVSALTGTDGALTTITGDLGTITTDLSSLPTTITTDLVSALTGSGDALTTITGDLGTITTDLGNISTEIGLLGLGVNDLLLNFGLGTISGI
jgi:hypothetical protein